MASIFCMAFRPASRALADRLGSTGALLWDFLVLGALGAEPLLLGPALNCGCLDCGCLPLGRLEPEALFDSSALAGFSRLHWARSNAGGGPEPAVSLKSSSIKISVSRYLPL